MLSKLSGSSTSLWLWQNPHLKLQSGKNIVDTIFPSQSTKLVSIIPLILYLSVVFFNIADFVKILGIGGVVSGGLTGILILLMNVNAKKKGDRKPEFSVPINWFIIGILSLIFILGIVVELF